MSNINSKIEIVYIVYRTEYDSEGNVKNKSKQKEYKTIEEAQSFIEKQNNKEKESKAKKKKYIDLIIIPTPKNIQIGTKFEVKDSSDNWVLYGIISRVTENFYYYDKVNGEKSLYGNLFMIDSFMDKISDEKIRVVVE